MPPRSRRDTALATDSTRRTMVDLNEMATRLVESRSSCDQSGNIDFSLELADNAPCLCVDAHLIEHVLLILLRNAEQAIAENSGKTGFICIETAVQGERIQLTVTDNGQGIHSRDMARIFEDGSARFELTMCAEMVKDHGGELYAWSSYGNGSSFTIDFPIHRLSDAAEDEVSGTSESSVLAGKRILVIDDEIHIAMLMVDLLGKEGARIDRANSGLQAVEQIRTQEYDLFICDQRMPDLSGERLYRSVASLKPEFRHRFLFVTGDAFNQEMHDFFTETGVRYIRKPFRSTELVQAVEQALNRTQQLNF
jgi:two-component system cell cycle sensor histidine kinase/response regulator CckA